MLCLLSLTNVLTNIRPQAVLIRKIELSEPFIAMAVWMKGLMPHAYHLFDILLEEAQRETLVKFDLLLMPLRLKLSKHKGPLLN